MMTTGNGFSMNTNILSLGFGDLEFIGHKVSSYCWNHEIHINEALDRFTDINCHQRGNRDEYMVKVRLRHMRQIICWWQKVHLIIWLTLDITKHIVTCHTVCISQIKSDPPVLCMCYPKRLEKTLITNTAVTKYVVLKTNSHFMDILWFATFMNVEMIHIAMYIFFPQ